MKHLSDLPHTILLIIGILWLAKSIWCIAGPGSFQRTAQFCMGLVAQANTLLGILVGAIAVALWVVILLYRPIAEWILILLGLLYFAVAVMLIKYRQYRRFLEGLVLQNSTFKTRLIGILSLVGAALAIWVAWADM